MAAVEQQGSSSHWREQGNQFYVSAKDNLSPFIRKERLQKASQCYVKAFNFSSNEEEKVSASKNLAMVNWKMAKVEETSSGTISLIVYFFKEAFKHFSFSMNHGKDVKPQSWKDNLLASVRGCWEEFKTGKIDELEITQRIRIHHDIVQHVQIDSLRADCFVELANCHFRSGIIGIQSGDYKRGIYELKDCYTPLNEAKHCGNDIFTVMAEVRILEEDVLMHQCMADSMQARDIGDNLYNKVLLEEEKLNMDMVYEVIDWYKQAVLRTREITEVELEAIALSRLGRVYDKVLKIKYKAKEYLMRSIQLAHSMHPRTFHSEEWFQDCTEILERYQKEFVDQESEKWQKERAELIKGIEKEINNIEKNDEKSSDEFLRFIYRVFPPKNKDHKLEGIPKTKKKGSHIEHDVMKKTLQKAIIHYHPDRADTEKHGKVWKVILEEITKCLTRRYECMK